MEPTERMDRVERDREQEQLPSDEGGLKADLASGADKAREGARKQAKKAASFWTKISEDWMLNFSGMLAYNYLTAIAPILLAVLAISGLVLNSLSPAAYQAFVEGLASHFPAGSGSAFVTSALAALQRSAGVLLVIAIVAAIFSGSRLFVALDNVFAVIFRVDVRPLVKQNIMALLMMLLFLALAPLAFFASSVPAIVLSYALPGGVQSNGLLLTAEGFIGGVIVTFILFGVIYYVVPNTQRSWANTWPGALATAVLLNIYEVLFPIYQSIFLKNAGLGSAAGLAVVILIFLYYIGVITLLGAEINSWVSGMRPLGATLPQFFRNQREEGASQTPRAQAQQEEQAERPAKGLAGALAALRRLGPRPSDDRSLRST